MERSFKRLFKLNCFVSIDGVNGYNVQRRLLGGMVGGWTRAAIGTFLISPGGRPSQNVIRLFGARATLCMQCDA